MSYDLDYFRCNECGHCHELCFCGESEPEPCGEENPLYECIITKKNECPNEYIDGKTCAVCKITDRKFEGTIKEDGWVFDFYIE